MTKKIAQDNDGFISIPEPDAAMEKMLDKQFKRVGPLRWRGLGDVVKSMTDMLGIKQCGGCAGRQEALNKWVPNPFASGPENVKPL